MNTFVNNGVSSSSDATHKLPSFNKRRFSFPSPFFDLASQMMPRNIKDLFRWTEHLYLSNGTVAQCLERVIKYPITHISFSGDDDELVKRYEDIFYKHLNFKTFISDVGIDLYNYGNSFTSIFFPFNRYLRCEKCSLETPVEKAQKVKFENFKFKAICRCGHRGSFEYVDRRSLDVKRFNLIRWNPKDIDISFNPITGQHQYYYTIPSDLVSRIKKGDLNLVSSLPKVFFEAVKKGDTIKINSDYVYHMKTTSLAGLNQEWGIPPTFRTFKLHFYTAILRKANEAIGLDYLTPIRVLFPQGQGSDPSQFMNIKKYKEAALNMFKQHRSDPGDAYFFPMPVGYQAIGGEMKALSVTPEIRLANEEIMNSLGFPQELFYGSLSIQAAPVALRLLENTLSNWMSGMQGLTQWVADKVSIYLGMPSLETSWAKVSLVDDIEKKQILMQLLGAQKVADDTFLSAVGTNISTELKKRFKQQKLEAEYQKKFEEEMKRMQEQDMQESPAGGVTPQDQQAQAQQVAEQWLNMDYTSRRQAMNQLAQQDEALYSMAKEIMTRLRRQASAQSGPPV